MESAMFALCMAFYSWLDVPTEFVEMIMISYNRCEKKVEAM